MRNDDSDGRYDVPAVRRAMWILLTLARTERPIGASELSRLLALPKTSVYRILTTLELDGFVTRTNGDGYELGPATYEVGSAYAGWASLESAFQRVARGLVREHNETVQLAVLEGTDVLYIGKEESSQPVRLVSRVGSRLPAHVTSLGKAILALLPEEELRALYPERSLRKMTSNSHGTLKSLLEDLRRASERGWAHDAEETAVGLQCVAAPILDQEARPVAAISVSIPTQRITPDRLRELGEAVHRAALDISRLIGFPRGHSGMVSASVSPTRSE